MIVVEVTALLFLAIAMAASLAQALAFAPRRRADPVALGAMPIAALPGFAVSSLAEAAAVCAVLALLLVTPTQAPAFLWVAASMAGLFGMNACYWLMARPATRMWLSPKPPGGPSTAAPDLGGPWGHAGPDWRALRERWARSHAVRAGLAMLSLGSLTAAVALGPIR